MLHNSSKLLFYHINVSENPGMTSPSYPSSCNARLRTGRERQRRFGTFPKFRSTASSTKYFRTSVSTFPPFYILITSTLTNAPQKILSTLFEFGHPSPQGGEGPGVRAIRFVMLSPDWPTLPLLPESSRLPMLSLLLIFPRRQTSTSLM